MVYCKESSKHSGPPSPPAKTVTGDANTQMGKQRTCLKECVLLKQWLSTMQMGIALEVGTHVSGRSKEMNKGLDPWHSEWPWCIQCSHCMQHFLEPYICYSISEKQSIMVNMYLVLIKSRLIIGLFNVHRPGLRQVLYFLLRRMRSIFGNLRNLQWPNEHVVMNTVWHGSMAVSRSESVGLKECEEK